MTRRASHQFPAGFLPHDGTQAPPAGASPMGAPSTSPAGSSTDPGPAGDFFGGEPPHIVIVLPLPGSINKQWQPVVRGGKPTLIKRKPAAAWMEAAQWDVLRQRGGDSCPAGFAMRLVVPAARTDLDAQLKAVIDACERGGAVTNDKHLRRLLVERDESREPGTCLIELWALPGQLGASERVGRKPTTRKAPVEATTDARHSRRRKQHGL